jgi:hypothetical protein|tara:strand:+ start:124 stop:357 length:234 start_codon:yes stop_codon:yes gene_type:complete
MLLIKHSTKESIMDKLKNWIKENNMSVYRFAKECDVAGSVAHRWTTGDCRPSLENCAVIARVTDGQVTANDFVPNID